MVVKQPSSDSSGPFSGLNVLLVDNIDDNQSALVHFFKNAGFSEIVVSNNGVNASNLLFQKKINVVVTAPQLPFSASLQLLKFVKANQILKKIPFVMIAETLNQTQVLESIQFGVDEYVIKPFSETQLVDHLRKAMFAKNNSSMNKLATVAEKNIEQTASKDSQQPLQILVVDDIADNIQILREVLRKEYKVKAATSGEKALQICEKDPQPDLVLLDIMMPVLDGMEVCRRLKANPKTQHIAVIFLSALDQTKNIVQGLELGAVDYITKPIDPPLVQARVRTHSKIIESNKMMRNQIDIMQENARLKEAFEQIKQKGYHTGSHSVSKRI